MDIVSKIRENASQHQENLAVVDGDVRFTYKELFDRVDRLSQGFSSLGLEKGDVLLAWLPNDFRALETELACLQCGAVWVTLNGGLTWPEVSAVASSTDPKVMISDAEHFGVMGAEGLSCCEVLRESRFVIAGDDTLDWLPDSVDYEALLESSSAERPELEIDDEDIARLRYTSGTTGKAKAAVLPQRAYLASLQNLQEQLHELTPTDKVLHAAPLTHASAALMYPILCAGGCNVILPEFDVELVLDTIEGAGITTMFCVPTMLQRMVLSPTFHDRNLSSIRTISYGGAPMSVEKLMPVIENLGTSLLQIYGLTEALHPVTSLSHEEHFPGNPKLGSVGRPTKINAVSLWDDGGLLIDGPDEVGEIMVKGPNVMSGYWRDEDETARVIADGWVATGDLAYRDEDGYYWIVDRKKDVIISGGFNVYSAEVEQVLNAHEAVAEACVIGLPHEDWGETVHGVVSLRDGTHIATDELVEWCRAQLAGYKTPKGFTVLHEPLPKNSAGKIVKSGVRNLALRAMSI